MKRTMQRRTAMTMAAAACSLMAAAAWANNDAGDKFKMMDANGDGMVSASEHAAAVTKMFSEMDANGDGNVTAAEMDAKHDRKKATAKSGMTSNDAAMDDHSMGHEMSSADKIAKMDTNGDGVLSASEHDSGAQAMFSQMDADGNGSLSRQEMAAGHAMMKPEKKGAEKTP
ncbi:EF-hand domain-containing protein [Lysobacter sp. Root494]|uniref:EF-hand domain-containing protein n=1 Tax=Lysobacter sp. Root494 TaxID=1736549 RepID=UPI000AEF7AEB|nr:EF-hand domain-containing protein [Lysobacter sp. Root494]